MMQTPDRKDYLWALGLTLLGCALGVALNAYTYAKRPWGIQGINLPLALGLSQSESKP